MFSDINIFVIIFTMNHDDELLQCFDENGNPTEARPRSEVKQEPYRLWYGTARVWVVNIQGQLLVSKRADHLVGNPGKWESYFGGHVSAGDSFITTARRELAEEAGIDVPESDLHFIDKGRNEDVRAFFENYAVLWNGNPKDLPFPDGEVTEAKWMNMDDYWKQAQDHIKWCCRCHPHQQKLILEWVESIT